MEIVEESIKLKIEIAKIKEQFLQLLNTFDEPQSASLSDAQSYLRHLYEWKKNRSSVRESKHSMPKINWQEQKTSSLIEYTSPSNNEIQLRNNRQNCEETLDQFSEHNICNKTLLDFEKINDYKPESHRRSQKNLSDKANPKLKNLLPDSAITWDAFIDMSILPRDSVVHDCDSFMLDDNIFESTVNFPINSTIMSSQILNKAKSSEKNTKSIHSQREDILDKAYHPYKRAFPQLSSCHIRNKFSIGKNNSNYSRTHKIIPNNVKSQNMRHGVMSALNTCQVESFYDSIEAEDVSENAKVGLKKQKAVSCLHSCIKHSTCDKDHSLPMSSLMCHSKDKNSAKNTLFHSKKIQNALLCFPLLSSS